MGDFENAVAHALRARELRRQARLWRQGSTNERAGAYRWNCEYNARRHERAVRRIADRLLSLV